MFVSFSVRGAAEPADDENSSAGASAGQYGPWHCPGETSVREPVNDGAKLFRRRRQSRILLIVEVMNVQLIID